MEPVQKRIKGQPTQQFDDEERTATWVMTSGTEGDQVTIDRDGESVDCRGGNFDNFLRAGGQIFFNHNTDQPPVGKMIGEPFIADIGEGTQFPEITGPKRTALLGRIQFSKVNPLAQQLWEQYKEGTLTGSSISFVPTGRTGKNHRGGNHYGAWDLIEYSLAPVGSNPDALKTNRKCASCSCKTTKTVAKASSIWIVYIDNPDGTVSQWRGAAESKEEAVALARNWKPGGTEYNAVRRALKIVDNSDKGRGSGAYKMGEGAQGNNVRREDNPFAADSNEWEDWNAGYDTADKPVEVSVKTTKAAKSPHRKGNEMRLTKIWHRKGMAWLVKSPTLRRNKDGGLDAPDEIQEYIEERGLDEVRIEEGPPEEVLDKDDPTLTEWVEEEIAEPEHSKAGGDLVGKWTFPYKKPRGTKPVQVVSVEGDIAKLSDGSTMHVSYVRPVNENDVAKADTGGAPSGKAEEVAADVAVRTDELVEQGVEEIDAVEASMEEQDVPKGMRPAVKALVARKRKTGPPNGPAGDPDRRKPPVGKSEDEQQLAQSFAQRVKDGQSTADSAADMLARRLGMESGGTGRRYALKLMEPYMKSVGDYGKVGSVCRTKRGNLVLVKSVRGKTARVVKVNGDEADEEEKSLSVKLKAEGINGPWGLPTKLDPGTWGLATKLTNWYGTITNQLKTMAPALKDVDLTGEEQKQVEENVEEAFMKIAKELGLSKAEGYEQQLDDAPGTQGATDPSLELGPQVKGLRVPMAALKSYVKNSGSWEHSKLAATVASRTWKLFKAINKDATLEQAEAQLTEEKEDPKEELVEAMQGMLAAVVAQKKVKWQKRFGGCGKAECTKDWFCKKCTKKLKAKLKECLEDQIPPVVVESKLAKQKADDLAGKPPSPESTISNEQGTPTPGGTDDANKLRSLFKQAQRKATEKARYGRISVKEDDDGMWLARASSGECIRFETRGEAQQFVDRYNRGDSAAVQEFDSEAEKSLRRKGTADEMTGDASQVTADVREMSGDLTDDDLVAMSKRFDRIDGKLNEFSGKVYKKTLVKI